MIITITGGRDRTPTIAELERARPLFEAASCVRQGNARGTDKAVAAWLRARSVAHVEDFPADWDAYKDRTGKNPAGAIRNALMLDGEEPAQLEIGGEAKPGPRVGRAEMLVAFSGGIGTANCQAGAVKLGITIEAIPPVNEPRPWNRHHGVPKSRVRGEWADAPSAYVGRGSPLGNPWPLEVEPGQSRADAAKANLAKYARWIRDHLADAPIRNAFMGITPETYLVCSCWPAHCHAEVIVRAWRHIRGIPRSGYG